VTPYGLALHPGTGVTNKKEAVSWFTKAAAKAKCSQALALLSDCYSTSMVLGRCVKRDNMLIKADDAGNAEAMHASCGRPGATGASLAKACRKTWSSKAADKGFGKAMDPLGHCFLFGEGVATDKSKALAWFLWLGPMARRWHVAR
jgi:TPR repeat protein